MPEAYDFANYYGVDPWGDITLKERNWYDPVLRNFYMRNAVYSPHASFKVDLTGPRARTIFFNDLIPPRPNIAPIDNRQMEASRLYTDSYQREVRTERHGNGMSIHRESELFNYWQRAGGGTGPGLRPIINAMLGQVVIDHLDILARNAFFTNPNVYMGAAGDASGFSAIGTSDKISTLAVDEIVLGMLDRDQPFSPLPNPFPRGNEIVCITTHGVIHDLKREVGDGSGGPTFLDVHKYAMPVPLIKGEMGMWRGVRFVANNLAKLRNTGTVGQQTTITAALRPGDGALDPEDANKVDGVRRVGQPGATHWVTVDDETGFEAGDVVTIHRLLHNGSSNNRGVANGVNYADPMAQTVQIYAVDTGKLILKEPYMMVENNGTGLETDLGGGVYGYVTKAQHIHTALFMNPNFNGLIAGVAQSPVFYAPPPVDDYQSMYRVAYDFWLQYQLWEPSTFEVWFGAGANRESFGGGASY